MIRFVLRALGFSIACAATCGGPQAAERLPADKDPALQMAETMPRAARALVLDMVRVGDAAVAVGERGHVLRAVGQGPWRQVENVPTRATLTAIAAWNDRLWAVGHDGVIVASSDAGLHWTRQRAQPYRPDADDAHNGVPLLDVLFTSEQEGWAVGAYALLLHTRDGGTNWQAVDLASAAPVLTAPTDGDRAQANSSDWTFDQQELQLEEESDPHLNAVARTGDGSLFIVAERGAAFRSVDRGATWQRLRLPYEGSMFGVIGYQGRHVLVFGLRGHVFESYDLGDTWNEIETGVDVSLMGGSGWGAGGAVLVGANGVVLTRSRAGQGFLKQVFPGEGVLSSVLEAAEPGQWLVAGENGVRGLPLQLGQD